MGTYYGKKDTCSQIKYYNTFGANPHTLSVNVCVPFMKPWLSKNAIQVHNKSVSSGLINKENPCASELSCSTPALLVIRLMNSVDVIHHRLNQFGK